MHGWRRFLLRSFGVASAPERILILHHVWAPWNLVMADHSCLSHRVDCYCVDKITIGAHSTVSQYSFSVLPATIYKARRCR